MNPALQQTPDDLFSKWLAALLAVLVHLLLIAVLYYGVNWQKKTPETFEVALVQAESPRAATPPPPAAEAVKPPPRQHVPPPAPVPEVEPKPPRHVDIAEPEAPKPVKKPKPVPPPVVEKPKPAKPKPEKPAEPEIDAQAARAAEQQRLSAMLARDADRARQQALLREETGRVNDAKAKASTSKALDEYINNIRIKVRGKIALPPGVSGNPEAVFTVNQLPTGEVMDVQLRRTSGNAALDAAIERAIHLASPLPLPSKPGLFKRDLELTLRPLEQ